MAGPAPRPLVAGNWKMNGLKAAAAEFARIVQRYAELRLRADLMVCPPVTLIAAFGAMAAGSGVAVGAQDCHPEPSGAFTGDISAEMLADAGASAVIVGHSERRSLHHETDALVRAKALAAHRAGLAAIVCIGETRQQREAGETLAVVRRQLDGSLPEAATAANLILAYEPVWAIGTGRTPGADEIARAHRYVRERLERLAPDDGRVRILYGGSVKAANAADILAIEHVDGALVGGASLDAAEFWAIYEAGQAH